MKDKTAQKAIVLLYLRKRRARKYYLKDLERLDGASWGFAVSETHGAYIEAHNALESMKRVLWHDNWN